MRVVINLLNFRPGRIGGTETYLRELVAHLPDVARNEHLLLLTSRDVAVEFHDSPLDVVGIPWTTAQICGLRLLEAATPRFRARTVEAAIAQLEPDVVLYPQQSMFPRTLPCPSVLVVHDLYHLYCPQHLSAVQRWFRRRSYPAAMGSADHVIAISEFTRRSILENFHCASDFVSVVPHGVRQSDPASIAPLDEIAGPYLYYPATSLPHKGHELLFRSVAALRKTGRFPYRLLLTGMQTKHWRGLRQVLRRLSLEEVVTHLGYVPYETVLRLVRGAACVVFPSQYEGFGIPVLEAAALERKVVTSRLDVFEEIGVPPENRIDFGDVGAFARAIADPTPIPLLRRPATWHACAAATLDILREAAGTAHTLSPSPFRTAGAVRQPLPPRRASR
jgi:glycosyltransferase involved in cell wall biosynthesis